MKSSPLFEFQKRFTAHLRDPKQNKIPSKISRQRMRVYSELLFNNIEDSVSTCYPILKKKLGPKKWKNLVRDFFAEHPCRSPYYRRIPDEFLGYLRKTGRSDLPYLQDLAFYEWVELDLYLKKDPKPRRKRKGRSSLLKNKFRINPLSHLFHSLYPLHHLERSSAKKGNSTYHFYLAYRNAAGLVRLLTLNAFQAQILAWLQKQPLSGVLLLQKALKKLKNGSKEVILASLEEVLKVFLTQEILQIA